MKALRIAIIIGSSVFKPDARHEKSVNEMFDQVIAWGGALKALREK
jgi:hypothetical protein